MKLKLPDLSKVRVTPPKKPSRKEGVSPNGERARAKTAKGPYPRLLLATPLLLLAAGYLFTQVFRSSPGEFQGPLPPSPPVGEIPSVTPAPPAEGFPPSSPSRPSTPAGDPLPSGEQVALPLPLPGMRGDPSSASPQPSSYRDPFVYPEGESRPKTPPQASSSPPPPVLPLPPLPSVVGGVSPPPSSSSPLSPGGEREGQTSKPAPPPPPPPPLGVVYTPQGEPRVLLLAHGEGESVEILLGEDSWGGYRYLRSGKEVVAQPLSPKGKVFRLRSLPGGGYAWEAMREKGGGL